MKTQRLFTLYIIFILLLSACSAAKPQTVPENKAVFSTAVVPQVNKPAQPQAVFSTASVETGKTVVIEKEVAQEVIAIQPAATAVPEYQAAPTQAPLTTSADNFFQQYGVNPFVDTIEDHLSTFAIDVDTASYSVARRYVNDGSLPPAEAIRVEEFVNYFDPGYDSPSDVAFGIYADGAPSPFQFDGTYILRFGIQGYRVSESERNPATLTFVIDVSGSMATEGRLELVKESLGLLVDRLRPEDSVAIVAYSTNAWVVLNPTWGNENQSILNAINNLSPMETTNAEAGLRLGYQLAMQAYRPGTSNRVILCSDGVANVGQTGPEAIMSEVRGYVDEGITLTAVGVGMGNFNDVLLEQLADNGDGNYAYIDNIDEARKVLVDDLVSTLQVIAYDAKVQVDFNPEVVARYRLIGYENRDVADQDFRNDSVDAGEIGAGHSVTALYAVQFKEGAQGRIATVQLRWQDPTSREVIEINGNFNTWDLAASFEQAAPRYQLAVVVAQYAEVLRSSPWAAETSLYQLAAHASRLAGMLSEDGDVIEFAALVNRASQIGR